MCRTVLRKQPAYSKCLLYSRAPNQLITSEWRRNMPVPQSAERYGIVSTWVLLIRSRYSNGNNQISKSNVEFYEFQRLQTAILATNMQTQQEASHLKDALEMTYAYSPMKSTENGVLLWCILRRCLYLRLNHVGGRITGEVERIWNKL
jgi:hypothetical protein